LSEKYLIVGLGNPGRDYESTRHNLGFLVLKKLAKELKVSISASSLTKGWTAKTRVRGNTVYFLLPSTYMNNSGLAVEQFVLKKKIAVENILVVTDDMNLDFGQLRIRKKGSDGGHNGLYSLIYCLKTNEFNRLRLGIGQPKKKQDTVDFVLEQFSSAEKKMLKDFIQDACQCCLVWMKEGINQAMNQFNRRKSDE